MARQRVNETQLNSYDEVDAALQAIGGLNRELSMIEADANERIDEIKAAAKEQSQPLLDVRKNHEGAIQQFCEAHKADFAKEKTREMMFGSVGFRLSTKIVIKNVAQTLKTLRDMELFQFLRVKEEADKEAMRDLDDETLAEIGASRKIDDVFGYTLKEESLEKAA